MSEVSFSVPSYAPKTLGEALRGPQGGYQLTYGYSLELHHGCMGHFPAIFAGTKIPIVSPNRGVIKNIWENLEPRRSKRNCNLFYVHSFFGFGYPVPSECSVAEETSPIKILMDEEFKKLTDNGSRPFQWAPGLLSLIDVTPEEFLDHIRKAA